MAFFDLALLLILIMLDAEYGIYPLTSLFASCNQKLATSLSRLPTLHEEALDQQFIAHLSEIAPAVTPRSGWIVGVETHFLGGGHHYLGRWEIADIGVLLVLRKGALAIWSKAAILQSKRLFPNGRVYDPDLDARNFLMGFGRLHRHYEPMRGQRAFRFDETSRYESLDLAGEQSARIDSYQGEFDIPVHYLLYNPVTLPWERLIPVMPPEPAVPDNVFGCRVLRTRDIFALRDHGVSVPSVSDLQSIVAPHRHAPFSSGWRLEDFVVSLLLGCHEGAVMRNDIQEPMEYLFNRRNEPIAAAFAVNLELPE